MNNQIRYKPLFGRQIIELENIIDKIIACE